VEAGKPVEPPHCSCPAGGGDVESFVTSTDSAPWPAGANGSDKPSPVPHVCVPVHQSLGLLNRFPVVFADKDLSRPCKAAGIQWVNAIIGHHIPHAANAATRIVFGKPCCLRPCSSPSMTSIAVADRHTRINAAVAVTIARDL
jgi:hypothetical protein